MDDTGKKLLNLMFKPNETVCVSYNKYGYHSISLENALGDTITLVPTPDSAEKRNKAWEDCIEYEVPTDSMTLVALNPIKGYRLDENTTSYRSFLVEVDYGPLKEQVDYLKRLGMPYSALIFSGNKSIHCLVTLDTDLPSYEVYYTLAEWILNIHTMADQNTKNPSRSIRIPGAEREPGKKQLLVEYKGPVKLTDLSQWLAIHPDAKPEKQEKRAISDTQIDLTQMKGWVVHKLHFGFDPTQGRNKQWFAIACEFALSGYSEEDTINTLSMYFTPDRDFKEREWKTAIRSGFKYIIERR